MKPDALKRLVNQMSEQVAKQYAQQQKAEMAELHNRFAEIIEAMKPSSENLLLVLELLRQETLGNLISRFTEIKATPPIVPDEPKEEPPKEA